PQLLIADEPTTALDVTVQRQVLELMRDLQQRFGMSLLFITHDLGVMAEVADQVVVMYRSRKVEEGATRELFHHGQHPYTRGLVACRPGLTSNPRRLLTVSDFVDAQGRQMEPDADRLKPQVKRGPEELAQAPVQLSVQDLVVRYPVRSGLFGGVKQ